MHPSLCLEMIFQDRPLLERLELARRIGYDTVEFWGWKDKPLDELRRRAGALGMRVGAFSANRSHGLMIASELQCLLSEVRESLQAAQQLGCRHLLLLVSPLKADGSADALPPQISPEQAGRQAVEALRLLAAEAARFQVYLALEPLNTRLDHPGYFLNRSHPAFEWVAAVDSPYVRVLYDVYHMHLMGKDVLQCVEGNLPWIGYLHFADAPGRHKPGTGGIPYEALCSGLHRLGYEGLVGLEFSPAGDDEAAARGALRYFKT